MPESIFTRLDLPGSALHYFFPGALPLRAATRLNKPLPGEQEDCSSKTPIAPEVQQWLDPPFYRWLIQHRFPVERLCVARQIHGAGVRQALLPGFYPDVDALYTHLPRLPLTVRTADCIAVLVVFPEVPAIGIAHAGWRGLRDQIVPRLIQEMSQTYRLPPATALVALSPYIGPCCYQVGPELAKYFPASAFREQAGRLYLNLGEVLQHQLRQLGIPARQVLDPGLCTFCSPLPLCSYRKSGTGQRMFTVLMLL